MPGGIAAQPEPTPIVELDEVDSTNLEALRRAAAGERGPIWLMARRQTAGRGRMGRSWQTLEGNLAVTFMSAVVCPPAALPQLSLVAGVAAHATVEGIMDRSADIVGLRLKWPNDLMLHGAKLGGILVESSSQGAMTVAAIGIGINLAAAPEIGNRSTTCLAGWGKRIACGGFLQALDAHVRSRLERWRNGNGFAEIRAEWLERASQIGTPVTVSTGHETVSGAFAGIDETGALLVSTVPAKPGEIRRFTFGDVSLLPPPQDQG